MSRIAQCFEQLGGRRALIPYICAGDPDPASTVPLMHALVAGGADIIELGVPFSDPMADGPVIQRASERALAHGVGLSRVLHMVREFRSRNASTPVVLMGYANPIERVGAQAFAQAAAEAGVDGVLIVDYPPEECVDYAALMRSHGLDPIFLLAPTSTPERVAAVGRIASGYVYYVSLKGVTGAGHLDVQEVAAKMAQIKAAVPLPVGVGFGIRDAASARAIAEVADAVVIGSRIIQEIEAAVQSGGPQQAVPAVESWLRQIRTALDSAVPATKENKA